MKAEVLPGLAAFAAVALKFVYDMSASWRAGREASRTASLEHAIADEALELEQFKALGPAYGALIDRLREEINANRAETAALRAELAAVRQDAEHAASENRHLKTRVVHLELALQQAGVPVPD